jgi:hypothetical protein
MHDQGGFMPSDYAIDAQRQLVYSRAWGGLTDADLFDHQRRLGLDPRFHPDFSQLLDFLGVTSSKGVTANGVKEVARRHLFGPHSRRALVASDPSTFGLARMFETYREIFGSEEQLKVFRSLEDAWAWLGISPREV